MALIDNLNICIQNKSRDKRYWSTEHSSINDCQRLIGYILLDAGELPPSVSEMLHFYSAFASPMKIALLISFDRKLRRLLI